MCCSLSRFVLFLWPFLPSSLTSPSLAQVGYQFRFFGTDAQDASRCLNIACFPSQHTLCASIPTHRLDIHVRRLLNAGHKVGVCRQQETAALKKVGENKSAPFTRALTALYTSATFVDELGVDPLGQSGATATLMCIVEDKPKGGMVDAKVKIGLVAVVPSTGLVIYDGSFSSLHRSLLSIDATTITEFEDGLMRAELETRLLHIQPNELLLQKDLSPKTESMVKHLAGQHKCVVPLLSLLPVLTSSPEQRRCRGLYDQD
jgi:DNA mismatch repair protein MSH3